MNKPLWTKDFTIITLGTVVSMLGNAVAGFAIGLLVLDYTSSVFLYALFMVCYSLPRIIMPLLAGPVLDRFSRRRAIYSLDFLSSAVYLGVFFLLRRNWFNYPVFICIAMLVGSIDSVYAVAYNSFFPTLISPGDGNYTRAYSISSLIYPLAQTIMVPIAGVCYKSVGLAPLFLFNTLTFLLAAIMETRISASEAHTAAREGEAFGIRRFRNDLREGLAYLKKEKGLAAITNYFLICTLTYSVINTLTLPYFKAHPFYTVTTYTFLMAVNTLGRLFGGAFHYRYRFPAPKKFLISVCVYIILSAMEGSYLFLPLVLMFAFQFFGGMLAVTSYNIRLSGTQSHVEEAMRGRFNGIFEMYNIVGAITGQLIAGALGDLLPIRFVIAGAMVVNILGVLTILVPQREAAKEIYNVNV